MRCWASCAPSTEGAQEDKPLRVVLKINNYSDENGEIVSECV